MTICLCAGCSALSSLFVPQQLSENYAIAAGVTTDAPAAVDGNMDTVSNNRRIVITLPEAKPIRKIVIHSPNISNLIVYGSIGQAGEWRVIQSVKGNKLPKITINAQVTTDKIRIFVSDTRGSRFAAPTVRQDLRGRNVQVYSRQVDARPIVQEIQLYGLIDAPQEDDSERIEPEAPLF